MPDSLHSNCPPASLIKQLAAMVYDSLLIIAILFISTAIALIFNDGNAIESSPVFSFYLLLIIFIFYSWFWSKSGQTLGMRVWKIRIISEFGGNPSWSICFLRLFSAIIFPMAFWGINYIFSLFEDNNIIMSITLIVFLLGYLWRLFKPYTWHDKMSQTSIINVSALAKEHQ
jgi:uncharacterized RDD family membrane protein YckC